MIHLLRKYILQGVFFLEVVFLPLKSEFQHVNFIHRGFNKLYIVKF